MTTADATELMLYRARAALHKPISPRPVVASLLRDVKQIITQRRQECYGALAVTDEQADELSRAITQRFLMEDI
jgi:hypothetical protein